MRTDPAPLDASINDSNDFRLERVSALAGPATSTLSPRGRHASALAGPATSTLLWQILSWARNALVRTKFTASRTLAFYVFVSQIGTVCCTNATIAPGDSSPAWWFWFVVTLAIMCWTALFSGRAPTRLDTVTANVGTQTELAAITRHGPDRIVTTYSGNCYHLDGCQATLLAHRDPNAAVLRSGTRFLKRCKLCMPDPRPADFDERERNRRSLRVPELAGPERPEPADELLNCPTTVTLNVLGWISAHIEQGNTWTTRRHWEEGCSQSCGCCRAANDEDWPSGCEACQDLWYFRGVNREARIRVQMYDGI